MIYLEGYAIDTLKADLFKRKYKILYSKEYGIP